MISFRSRSSVSGYPATPAQSRKTETQVVLRSRLRSGRRPPSRPRWCRWVVCVALATLVGSGTSLPWASAATPTLDRADAAAGWLARQMVEGERFESVFDGVTFPDQGLVADAVMAFAAAGVADDAAGRATSWLTKPDILSGYVGDGSTSSYAGAHAKLLLVAEVRGVDPTSFGGVDLVERLAARLTPSGRYQDLSGFGDFSNGITQSLAVIAMTRRPGGAPAAAVNFLAASQCPDGGFPQTFGADPCTSSVDVTGFAAQAMAAAGRFTDANQALDFLVGAQAPSGGFGTPANANSTGLAVSALAAGGRAADSAAVTRGADFIRSLTVGCEGPAEHRGAVAYDATGFFQDTAPRATAQAILGLAQTGLADLHRGNAVSDSPVLSCPSTGSTPSTTPSSVAPVLPSIPTAATAPPSTSAVPVQVLSGAAVNAAVTRAPLARTGSPTGPLALLGLFLIAVGVAVRTGARPRPLPRP